MPVFRDAVSDTTTTTGTGTITLAGSTAVAGTRTISSAHSNADTLYYRIESSDNTEWEVGLGTYTSSGTTLSRDTILASSNSGSAVNFSAGTKNVYTVIPASFRARGTITANDPFEYTQTWNAAGVTFTGLRVNITNTASASASLLADFQVGGTSQFSIRRDGQLDGISNLGSSGLPGVAFTNSVAIGVVAWVGGVTRSNSKIFLNGSNGTTGLALADVYPVSWSSTSSSDGSIDLKLQRDAAATLAQRNGTNAQTFRIYNTFTDGSNYGRASLGYSSNIFTIQTETAGTGAGAELRLLSNAGDVRIRCGPSGWVEFGTGSTNRLRMTSSSQLLWVTDNSGDIGADGATRPRNLFLGSYMQMTEMTAPSAPSTNNVRIYAEDNGSGKTRLMALFPTGAAQQIAIEP